MTIKHRYVYGFVALIMGISFLGCLTTSVDQRSTTTAAAGAPIAPGSSLPNVILIIVDTLRSDHVSAHGYSRPTTPNLDTLIAAEGVLFHSASVSAPWTCPSNAAVMTGRSASAVGSTWETIGKTIPPGEHTLAEHLYDAGYYTAGFTSGPYCVNGALGFDQGFDRYDDSFAANTSPNKARAEEVNDLVIDWLDNTWVAGLGGTKPLFLFVYYFDPHTWYDPPPPYDTLYDPDYSGPLTPELFGHGQTAKSGELVLSERDLEHLVALYDGEITYWDFHLGQLLNHLNGINLLENALVIITADHGEMLGEHGEWSHAGSLYEEVLRVPLLMRYTGVITPGMKINTPVQTMDLMPTVLDYINIPISDELQALSLRSVIEGTAATNTRSIFSEVDGITDPNHSLYWAAPRDDLRAIRQDEWKLIYHRGQYDGDELYQLKPNSLYETDNLIQQQPDRVRQLHFDLLSFFFPQRIYLPFGQK
jgi:arylsulfatase A-like enzyme